MKLRDFQEQIIEELREGWRKGHNRQVVGLATGGGKMGVSSRTGGERVDEMLAFVDRIA